MEKNDGLKILTANIVYESKLTDSTKVQLLNYIKEADSYQLMSLLLDKKINKLDENAKMILEQRFKTSKYNNMLQEIMPRTKSVVGGLTYGTPQRFIYRKIRSMMNVCTKKCGTYELNTFRRQVCMLKCNIGTQISLVTALTKSKTDPEKIQKAKIKLTKLQRKLRDYISSAKRRGAEV